MAVAAGAGGLKTAVELSIPCYDQITHSCMAHAHARNQLAVKSGLESVTWLVKARLRLGHGLRS